MVIHGGKSRRLCRTARVGEPIIGESRVRDPLAGVNVRNADFGMNVTYVRSSIQAGYRHEKLDAQASTLSSKGGYPSLLSSDKYR